MFVDPTIEEPARTMIGHAVRQEFDDLETEMRRIGNDTFLRAMELCISLAAYVVIDIAGRWPTDADLREVAGHTAKSARGFQLSQEDVQAFLSRVALGTEQMAEVFPSATDGVMIPLQVTSTLLLAFRPSGQHWWEYLDRIESALDTAEQADLSILPALMLRSQRVRGAASK